MNAYELVILIASVGVSLQFSISSYEITVWIFKLDKHVHICRGVISPREK